MTESDVWTAQVEQVLRLCGWFPTRKVNVDRWYYGLLDSDGLEMHSAAREFLEQFGGLHCELSGSGEKMACISFDLDPGLCEGQGEMIRRICPNVGVLFPVGEVGGGNATLVLSEDSLLYMVFEPKCLFVGKARNGLANLISGNY